ncbi:hypothetical protein [Halorussus sp. MSC15.2]|uniref:hypothetical protein n=1 Tax=Halorussus sp. MSC15.2 TaxID=2283638 RepID=UPI0013D27E16|nr:hypothetical protein [Halorussus sp. MSC15.2]NEU58467.1 hypothetical protein [Halorussus sp. MSC15.2]
MGEEDLQSYEVTRQILGILRNSLRTDYTATTKALDGYPETLGGTKDMPTNGWTVQYSTQDALGARWNDYLTSRKTSSQGLGEILGRLFTPEQLYPTADRYGDSVVYDSIDGFEDYTVYRIDMDDDAEIPDQRKLTVRLNRPNQKSNAENLTRFDAVLTQERPENITDLAGTQLHDVEDPGSTTTQKLTLDATKDTYYLVVRSNITVGMYQMTATTELPGTTGSDGGTAVEVVDRQGRDAQRPELTLDDAPAAQELRHGKTVRVSADESASLRWHTWDVGTDPNELEYKYRISNDTGTSDWSSWRSVGNEGYIYQHLSLSEGYHDLQMVVRDPKGYRTERIVTLKTT